MSARGSRSFEIGDLPQSMPVFPLTGALLLPDGHLPLNIFEPRYLAMVEDTLMSRDRLIGMIQPREAHAEGMTRGNVIPPAPALYPTGCAGRIVNFSETDDGRYLITLHGICRFDLREELPTPRGYRRIVPDFSRWHSDLKPPAETTGIDRERLLRSLRTYFDTHGMKVDWDAIMQTPSDRLITLLSMMCPFAPPEKQALIEAATFADRAQAVITLIEMGATGHDDEIARH